jgi:hypothetical protein
MALVFGLGPFFLFERKYRMNILCKLFGHQPPVYAKKGWWSPGEEYAKVNSNIEIDGIKREHASVYSECPRCHINFKLCRIHLPRKDKNETTQR